MKRRNFLIGSVSAATTTFHGTRAAEDCPMLIPFTIHDVDRLFPDHPSGPRPDVACFYYQSWYRDPARMRALGLPPDYTEWDRVAAARQVMPCQIQPKIPAWGQFDATNPEMVEREVVAARDAGIDIFVYDWDYVGDRPFSVRPLENGFLRSRNREDIRFSILWINHDYITVKLDYDSMDWEGMIDLIANRYAKRSNYWRIDGLPVLGIYRFRHMREHFGVTGLRLKLNELRAFARKAGLPGLYIYCCTDYYDDAGEDPGQAGFDATTMYTAANLAPFIRYKTSKAASYGEVARQTVEMWNRYAETQSVPLFPDCPVGWDNSARLGKNAYVILGRSADQFAAVMEAAKRFIWRRHIGPPVVFLSCWNEWSEDHYLLPDEAYGDSYLRAVKQIFGR